jgi:hypothetical protein
MVLAFLRETKARLRRWDPNTDPTAEPLSTPALIAMIAGTAVNLFFFYAWRYQPMQDFPLHVACAKYVAEWGRNGSPYAGLFARPDLLAANTLIYSLGGYLAKVFDALSAVRFLIATMYIVLLPVAMLYALRTFGRSAWGAVLSTSLVFVRLYASGFANELIAFPLALLVLARFYALLKEPSRGGALGVAVGLCLVLLAHSFVFMWLGAVLAGLSAAALPSVLRRGLAYAGKTTACVVLSIAPSLALFARWYLRSSSRFGADAHGATFGPTFIDANEQFRRLTDFIAFSRGPEERAHLAWLILLVGVSVALSRLERRRAPPVLEIACVVTFFSYFLLPVHIASEGVVSKRELDHAMWLLPALATPVAARTSKLARWIVVAGILVYACASARYWHSQLVAFERDEAKGLATVLAAAPPGLRMHYPRINIESQYFVTKTLWHVEGYYVAQSAGMIRDIPGADDPRWWLHFEPDRHGLPTLNGQDTEGWSQVPAIWDTYDLILLHRWRPTPEAMAAARAHATRIAQSGDWELWRTNR